MKKFHSVLSLSLLGGCLTLASCAATQPRSQTTADQQGMHEVSAAYARATDHHRRPFRKPVQDHTAREMRLLAEKTDGLLAATADWGSDARLTAAGASDKNTSREKIQAFRSALEELKIAAEKGDTTAVRQSYAQVIASYEEVSRLAGTVN